ncbi:Unknown protein, partial [Striga hermonthica]
YPTLAHVVTELADYFKIPASTEEGIGAAVIGYEELRAGGFLNKGLKVTHFSERKCYEVYLREEELKRMARGE